MEKSTPMAIAAVIISVIAITSTIVLRPTLEIGAGAVGTNELADSSVTSPKILDGTIQTIDIAPGVITELAIEDNSITSAKILDGTIVDADITTAGISRIADDAVTSAKILDGTIQTIDIAAGALTKTAENFGTAIDNTIASWVSFEDLDEAGVEITTDNNPVLIMFSGVFSNNTAGGRVRILLHVDGIFYGHATRTGTSAAAGDPFVLAFNCMPTLSAGTHTVQVVWCVMAPGQVGSAYNRVLNVIELKR